MPISIFSKIRYLPERVAMMMTTFVDPRLQSRDSNTIGIAEDSLFRWKLADFVPLQGRPCDSGVADERQSRVTSGIFQEDVLAAWMAPQELRAVVHVIVDHEPAVVGSVVPGNLGQIDRPKLVARLFLQSASLLSDGIVPLRNIVTLDLQEVLPRWFHVSQFERMEGQVYEIHAATGSECARAETQTDFVI